MIPLIIKETTGSTSHDLWEDYGHGNREPRAILAAAQTEGKGRFGRRWHSDPVGNLYLSVLLFLGRNMIAWLPAAPLVAALEVLAVLRLRVDLPLGIKWPNDLMVGERKFGGILSESRIPAGEEEVPLVIGVGLNLNASTAQYPADLQSIAVTLADAAGKSFPVIDIAGEIVYNFESRFALLHALHENHGRTGKPYQTRE